MNSRLVLRDRPIFVLIGMQMLLACFGVGAPLRACGMDGCPLIGLWGLAEIHGRLPARVHRVGRSRLTHAVATLKLPDEQHLSGGKRECETNWA